jgi:hypothetical protein
MKNINDIEVNNPEFVIKQETLEEVAERYVGCFEFGIAHPRRVAKNAFINGAKWQQEQDKNKFSDEEDIAIAFNEGQAYSVTGKLIDGKEWAKTHKKEWFEQFKKK